VIWDDFNSKLSKERGGRGGGDSNHILIFESGAWVAQGRRRGGRRGKEESLPGGIKIEEQRTHTQGESEAAGQVLKEKLIKLRLSNHVNFREGSFAV